MARTKKSEKPETVVVEEKPQRYKGWDVSRIFWGLLLILVGVLVLLDNLGFVDVDYQNIVQLWPLLIVGWGVSLLNIKGSWWSVVSALLMVAILALLAWVAIYNVPFGNESAEVQSQSRRVDLENNTVDNLDVSVRGGAGTVTVGSHGGRAPVEARLNSDFASLDVDSRVNDTTQFVEVSPDGSRMWWSGNVRNDLKVDVSRQLALSMDIKTGAADLDVDLSRTLLQRLSVDVGASRSIVTIGDRVDDVSLELKSGASSMTVRVPRSSGVKVQLDRGISSQNLEGLTDTGDGVYETAGFASAAKKITIRGNLGASSFTLERY